MDSEDSDSDEDDFAGQITADKVDQRRAARRKATTPDHSLTGSELFDICGEIERHKAKDLAQASVDQVDKRECDESLPLFREQLQRHASPEHLATSAHGALKQGLENAAKAKLPSGDGEIVVTRKRAASAGPCTPVLSGKRIRITGGPETI